MAAAAAAAVAATVTVSSGAGIGPADDVVRRPGLLRRCISMVEASSSSRCPSSAMENNQGGEGDPAEPIGTGVNIPRSTSWGPFSGTSFEPPRGLVHHRRPSIPTLKNNGSLSSLSGNKCELGSNIVPLTSPSNGIKAPPVMPAPAPANLALISASPTPSSSPFCGIEGGLRISPLERSNFMCSASDADLDDEAQAASFCPSGALGSDGAPHLPVAGTPNDVAHAGGPIQQGGVTLDERRTKGTGVRSAIQSPHHGRGRSAESAPRSPERLPESASLSNAETPKLNRQNSCFNRKAKNAHRESISSRQHNR